MLSVNLIPIFKDNYVFAVHDEVNCVVIDPGAAEPVETYLANHKLKLIQILCTHHHWDHIDGVAELARKWICEVWCSKVDLTRIAGATAIAPNIGKLLGEEFITLDLSGHTLGQIGYHFPRLGYLFSGDAIFSAGCGRLFEGTFAEAYSSLQRIATLPINTQIFFTHEYTLRNIEFVEHYGLIDKTSIQDYRQNCEQLLADGKPTCPSTVAAELKINPFLHARTLAQFTQLRQLRDRWD